ncbi:MAG: DNA polymerase III subunit gamma/tau, partial [Prevotella sp.]
LASRLKNLTPRISEYPIIEIVLDNEILLQQATEIKGSITVTMRKTLGNNAISLSLRLADPGTMKKALTKREIFDNLRQENPALEKLRKSLGLELA